MKGARKYGVCKKHSSGVMHNSIKFYFIMIKKKRRKIFEKLIWETVYWKLRKGGFKLVKDQEEQNNFYGRTWSTFIWKGHLDGDFITSPGQELIGGTDNTHHTQYTTISHCLGKLIKYDEFSLITCNDFLIFMIALLCFF